MGTAAWVKMDPRRALGSVCLLLSVWVAAFAPACTPAATDDDGAFDEAPGKQPWSEEELSCGSNDDCAHGEACEDGRCRMARCAQSFESKPPLGGTRYLGIDDELVVVSDASYLDSFSGESGGYVASHELDAVVMGVVAGNFDGRVPRGLAIALDDESEVELELATGKRSLLTGVFPKAIAAGDVDGDGLDELVVVDDTEVAICHVDTDTCSHLSLSGGFGTDVAVADVDADGYAEVVVLVEQTNASALIVWNEDAEVTGQDASVSIGLDVQALAMAAGDVDGDGAAEIGILVDGGWLGFAKDQLRLLSGAGATLSTLDVDADAIDLAMGDRDADGKAEVALLRDDLVLELLEAKNGSLVSVFSAEITVASEVSRIAMLDFDGDSAAAEIVDGPELVAGALVPTMVVAYPPYPGAYGDGSPGVYVGESSDVEEAISSSVSLGIGIMVGFGVETPLLEASVSVSLERSIELTHSVERSMSIGRYFSMEADLENFPAQNGAVVVSCGCFHRYRYRSVDENGVVGGSGQVFEIFLPVGGQTQPISTQRYNAMAAETGTMPVIDIPYRLGDLASYPATPSTFAGQPIAHEDMLFPSPPTFHASELAEVNFRLSAAETETNSVSMSTTIGVKGSLGAAGVEVELSGSAGFSQGYEISVGNELLFWGWIPPIVDDPKTPEDEYLQHRYAFSPQVHRQWYENAAGERAAYYVMGYTATR